MELDKRIIEGKKPLTAFDVMESKFIGTDCYFSDNASDYGDLSNCQIGILLSRNVITGAFNATKNNSYANFNYCLPGEWVEQKSEINFEPYNLVTFENEFNIGDIVTFRGKSNTDRAGSYYKCVYSGYRFFSEKGSTNTILIFGLWGFSLSELFDLYEINRDGKWQPFGKH